VTEMVTGIDLVKEQLLVASGMPLRYRQEDVEMRGHAIECRINAEDPERGFAPGPGRIVSFHPPGGPGVRLDTHIYTGYEVGPQYDSLLAKLICHGRDRAEAMARMERSLDELVVDGIPTSAPFHREVLRDEVFRRGEATTHFLDEHIGQISEAMAAAARA